MPRFPSPTAPAELNADPVIEDPLLRTASDAFAALDPDVTYRLMQQAAYASDLEKYHTHALEPLGIIAYGYLLPLLEELRRLNADPMLKFINTAGHIAAELRGMEQPAA